MQLQSARNVGNEIFDSSDNFVTGVIPMEQCREESQWLR